MKSVNISVENLSEETAKLYEVLNHESDLAAILIGASFIDACLLSILENTLLKGSTTNRLLSHQGMIGSFKARAELCYVMGLVPKSWYVDFGLIGEIRNAVAHHRLVSSFDNPEIAEKCAQLSTHLQGDWSNSIGRTRFTLCVVMLANALIMKALMQKTKGGIESAKEPNHTYFKLKDEGE